MSCITRLSNNFLLPFWMAQISNLPKSHAPQFSLAHFYRYILMKFDVLHDYHNIQKINLGALDNLIVTGSPKTI